MSGVGALVVLTAVAAAGTVLAIDGWLPAASPLTRVLDHLRRPADSVPHPSSLTHGVVAGVRTVVARHPKVVPSRADLALVGRTLDEHILRAVTIAAGAVVAGPLLLWGLQVAGVVALSWYVPVGLPLLGAVCAVAWFHAATAARASAARSDLRYQVSAFLDVVTMLLAGNAGYEGALEQAAGVGDGRLFVELRRRIREAGTRGASLTTALAGAGEDLGIVELERVAAAASLSAAEGAPIAKTLAAKCATLRATLATEQETEARLRTSRLTSPIVGMALIFMALVVYPALSVPI